MAGTVDRGTVRAAVLSLLEKGDFVGSALLAFFRKEEELYAGILTSLGEHGRWLELAEVAHGVAEDRSVWPALLGAYYAESEFPHGFYAPLGLARHWGMNGADLHALAERALSCAEAEEEWVQAAQICRYFLGDVARAGSAMTRRYHQAMERGQFLEAEEAATAKVLPKERRHEFLRKEYAELMARGDFLAAALLAKSTRGREAGLTKREQLDAARSAHEEALRIPDRPKDDDDSRTDAELIFAELIQPALFEP